MFDCEALERICILNVDRERKESPCIFYILFLYHSAFCSRRYFRRYRNGT